MNKIIVQIYFTFLLLSIMGCAYTIPREMSYKESLCPPDSMAILPDLEIIDIESNRHYTPGVTREHFPEPVTTFIATVSNIGKSSFKGPLELSIIDKPKDVRAIKHESYSINKIYTLQVGDTIQVQVMYYGWYATNVQLIFKLHTDPNCIECNPICERSYENNFIEYSIP
jgi:hypothetical protein